jgi:AcrR family transcriptional regulator
MEQRERILEAVGELTTARRRLPSIMEVATEVGLTKQGVLHYFPTRSALDAAVVARAVARVDIAMREAAAAPGGSPTATYLRLSSPDDGDCAAAVVVLAAAAQRPEGGLAPEAQEAASQWETLITDEVGDAVRAEVVRLVGDGLFVEALITGVPPATERIERLVAHLRDTLVERRT